MAKLCYNCMVVFLLLCMISYASSRPHPGFHDETPMDIFHGENCEGNGEEECLMRRTLAAHIDYIYTQKEKQH